MSNIDYQKVLNHKFAPIEFELTEKDVALYSLGIGAGTKNLKFVYENAEGFTPIPSIGVIFPFKVLLEVINGISGLSDFNPMMLLHGEQYLEVRGKIPTKGSLVTYSKVNNLYDKGKGVLLVIDTITKERDSGREIVFNQFSLFIRGIGGFGGERGPSDKPIAIPSRKPDAVHTQKTTTDQALIYRLAGGDLNPLHADPEMSKLGGFEVPILHGLCSFGVATRAILEHFCDNDPERFKSIRVRFSKHVFPGETIQTEMWKLNDTQVVFQSKVLERDGYTLSNAIAEIKPAASSKL
ncbi:hypothetical peroxisomal multifunctional enzyme 2 [Heterostelium album PN500]|uniref:Hypothetical peroxisomal multifunctional enzyme 2 n=1 Tax=Heterostelium pallidum (strain ATCC 26659 / Pp 5 / PN500) TaxID=670386 RepID=D3B6E6_HETP5|nr:hypothetical peroxisomal multifunctional enzyme 2 [Heterostelium album PN500]EFA82916.1 hypothetical peroxisomal multifunctional enzyme 2 [Heterostelium album PN500]|eukprot:XP_020435033.1 hypothetical peroxisomal multifunctional enzyme 2 [Heterostelium album PN500]